MSIGKKRKQIYCDKIQVLLLASSDKMAPNTNDLLPNVWNEIGSHSNKDDLRYWFEKSV